MTYEEALKHFKNHEYMTDFSWQDEMSEIAITAIEKQIAKKPTQIGAQVCTCPTCSRKTPQCDYCIECGQRLLWEDANEEISHRDQTRRG